MVVTALVMSGAGARGQSGSGKDGRAMEAAREATHGSSTLQAAR